MALELKIADLVTLVQLRYHDWTDFEHPRFVADEIAYKQETIRKAKESLSLSELDALIASADYDAFLERLTRLCQDNNLLWRRVPAAGDTAVLTHPALDKPTFCTHIRNLLHGDRPSPDRLQTFSDYCTSHNLPNKWPFPTYLLFITHPQTEMFVKPRTAEWFLKFMGEPQTIVAPPTAVTYHAILEQAANLFTALQPYGVGDMVDLQSLVWVSFRESKNRVGRLNSKGQVDLDVPPTEPTATASYSIHSETALIREKPQPFNTILPNPTYSLDQCAAETGFAAADLQNWVDAIERKGQAVLYGPPGTGKTFLAEKLAQHLVGDSDGFSELIQFHPAYAYEDFVQGIRPFTHNNTVYYKMISGRLLQFCEKARGRNGRCVLIIDEINRANLSAVFGELMYLLEYREREISLAGNGRFSLPANLRILGTMNTADRSIALVDHALRRRFAFIHLSPNYDLLRHYHQGTGFDPGHLINLLQQLNNQIGDPHFHIGPTFFLQPQLQSQLESIWRLEIEPYLEEYFFSQPEKITAFRWDTIERQLFN